MCNLTWNLIPQTGLARSSRGVFKFDTGLVCTPFWAWPWDEMTRTTTSLVYIHRREAVTAGGAGRRARLSFSDLPSTWGQIGVSLRR